MHLATDAPDAERGDVRHPLWKRLLLFVLVGGVLASVIASDRAHDGLMALLEVAEPWMSGHPALGMVVFVGLAALSATLAFFSSAVIVPAAVAVWGNGLTMLLLWLGWTLGGCIAYLTARFLGRPLVGRLGSSEMLERYEERITAHAPFGLVVLFLLVLQSEVPGYVLGLARYRFAKFVLALALVEIPFAVLTVYVGTSLIDRQLSLLIAAGAVAALIVGLAFVALRRRLQT